MSADYLPPPNTPFGHPLHGLRSLDPGIRFLINGFFGAVLQRLTFVENATVGTNAVLRSRCRPPLHCPVFTIHESRILTVTCLLIMVITVSSHFSK